MQNNPITYCKLYSKMPLVNFATSDSCHGSVCGQIPLQNILRNAYWRVTHLFNMEPPSVSTRKDKFALQDPIINILVVEILAFRFRTTYPRIVVTSRSCIEADVLGTNFLKKILFQTRYERILDTGKFVMPTYHTDNVEIKMYPIDKSA